MGKTYTKKGEFKGFPVLLINYMDREGEERTLISFGVKKAEGILEHSDEIAKFVEENSRKKTEKSPF